MLNTEKIVFEDLPTSKLADMLNPENPRWIDDEIFERLQSSLVKFDCLEPIIINTVTNQVVGGHQRVKAAIAAKIKTLPVVKMAVAPEHEKAFNLLLNKVKGDWDYQKLADALEQIYQSPEVLAASGFLQDEAEVIVNQYSFSLMSPVDSESGHELGEDVEEAEDDEDTQEDTEEEEEADRDVRTAMTGVISTVRNLGKQETEDILGATVKIQFGMFSRHIPVDVYSNWVEGLKAESTQGENPGALGAVIARRLDISVKRKEELADAV